MRAGTELQSPSGREGGLGFSVLLPTLWKYLPEQPAPGFVLPCLSNSSLAQYSFWFCLQPGFNPTDLLLLLRHCGHGVLCWCGLPQLLQVSTTSTPLQCFWCTTSSSELWQLCLPRKKGPESGSGWGFVAVCGYLGGKMGRNGFCLGEGKDFCGRVGLVQ